MDCSHGTIQAAKLGHGISQNCISNPSFIPLTNKTDSSLEQDNSSANQSTLSPQIKVQCVGNSSLSPSVISESDSKSDACDVSDAIIVELKNGCENGRLNDNLTSCVSDDLKKLSIDLNGSNAENKGTNSNADKKTNEAGKNSSNDDATNSRHNIPEAINHKGMYYD